MMVADFLGKPIETLRVEDVIGRDRAQVRAEADRLPPEAKLQLKTKLNEMLRAQFLAVRDARAEYEAVAMVVNIMDHVRAQGRLEGMREAIAAGMKAASPGGMAAAGDSCTDLAKGARKPLTSHIDDFFKEAGISAKSEREYRYTYRMLDEFIGTKPIGLISDVDLVEFMEWLTARIKPRQGRSEAAAAMQGKDAWVAEEMERLLVQAAVVIPPREQYRRVKGAGRLKRFRSYC